ncbi:MAG: hypothetical protein J6L24_01970, partial [Oscillospiraceae bacterium]|nr:hypothetical protein [Oscillospiraceae bacterium]
PNGESFAPAVQFQKREIHTVFPRFRNFRPSRNLLPPALADFIRASLEGEFLWLNPTQVRQKSSANKQFVGLLLFSLLQFSFPA